MSALAVMPSVLSSGMPSAVASRVPCGDLACLSRLAVLIPAWQPDRRLLELVRSLVPCGFGAVIVVDDGSSGECEALFEALGDLPGVFLVRHAVNLGKGRALKTGSNHFLASLPELEGLVTADADGQHLVGDIVKVGRALSEAGGRVVLGARTFAQGVPLRSRIGNDLTRQVFRFVSGVKVADTQTGLRAFPRSLLPELMRLGGERYEYEMTVLAHVCRTGKRPVEVPIETVYLDDNRSSHFDPIRDSMRIYLVLARFYMSSAIAAGIDILLFWVAFKVTGILWAAVAVGRLSALANFALNRRFVFSRGERTAISSGWRYVVLALGVAASSYGLISLLTVYGGWNVLAAKITGDVSLSLVSFSAQRSFVFRRREGE